MDNYFNIINPISELIIVTMGAASLTMGQGVARLGGLFFGVLLIALGVYFSLNFVHEQLVWGLIWISVACIQSLFKSQVDEGEDTFNLKITIWLTCVVWAGMTIALW